MEFPYSDNYVTIKKNEACLHEPMWENSKLYGSIKKKKMNNDSGKQLALFTEAGGMYTLWANNSTSRGMYIYVHIYTHTQQERVHRLTQDTYNNGLHSIINKNTKLKTIQMLSTVEQISWDSMIGWNANSDEQLLCTTIWVNHTCCTGIAEWKRIHIVWIYFHKVKKCRQTRVLKRCKRQQ